MRRRYPRVDSLQKREMMGWTMQLNLEGKIVLVTGGSKGIGLACARLFLEEGARVALCSRSQSNIDNALSALPPAFGVAADLTGAETAARMVERVENELGPIDILVNCAGAARRVAPDELTPAAWREAFDAKFFTYINVMDPLVKRMAGRGRGVIVNVIGIGGKVAMSAHLAGGAANSALMLATAGLGSVYASKGVRVVGVNPGFTETERLLNGLAVTAKLDGVSVDTARCSIQQSLPLGRMTSPEEVAEAVVFLASSRASYLTGVTLSMDGGQYPFVV
jgi:NAD(P)-dependent dehydrogenase (short-subunit alcohol dehydrogenase family)